MKNQNAPTMKDVAKKAGVSLGTVSKVINNIPVGPSYRLKVEQAIKELNYEVNTYARGLKTNRTNIIALIIPDNINPFFSGLAHYIEAALYQRKYKLMLCCSDGIREKEIEYLNLCSQNKVDGIIALTYSDIGNYVSKSIPLVSFDRHFDNNFTPMVSSDNYMGGVIATEKLIELGCKRPAFIRFSSSIPGEADKRKDGYFDTCKKYNIPPIVLDKNVFAQVDKELEDFICEHEQSDHTLDFDGIFSNTDLHAFKAKKILEHIVLRCPYLSREKPYKIYVNSMDASAITLKVEVFVEKIGDRKNTVDYLNVNTLKRFNEANINIPFNRLDVTILNQTTGNAIRLADKNS